MQLECHYIGTTLQSHKQQCGNDVLTNHQWTSGNYKIILIFNIFITFKSSNLRLIRC